MNAAHNGAIIRVMPGVYREEPSRRAPEPDERCKDDYDTIGSSILESGVTASGGGAKVANYEYQRKCPNAQNLIAIIGDGTGRGPDLRLQVQPADPGHGPPPPRRPDLRPADQAQRDPRRPCRRDLPEELHGRVLGLQQHLHPRDQRLPDGGHHVALLARVRLPVLQLRPRALQPASRRSAPATPASTPAPGPRATASGTGSRSAGPTRTTTRSATRARPATACGRTTTSSTTTRPG